MTMTDKNKQEVIDEETQSQRLRNKKLELEEKKRQQRLNMIQSAKKAIERL